jgi:hypothetical protein
MFSVEEVENHLIALIAGWADKFGRIAAIMVPGNHGRNTAKPRTNNKVYESHEWKIFCAVEKHFRDDRRVSIYVPNEIDAFFSIFGHKFMVTHGDSLGVKGGDGLIGALGPIARGTLKVGAQQRRMGRDFETLVMGHYHFYIPRGDGVPVLLSPALIGPSMYGYTQLRAPPSRPSQALAFVHPRHGFTAQWPMYLDKKYMAHKRDPWFQWSGARTVRDLGLGA